MLHERVTPQTVGMWRRRFIERGLDGLLDEPRPGVPRTIDDAKVERVIDADAGEPAARRHALEHAQHGPAQRLLRGLFRAGGPIRRGAGRSGLLQKFDFFGGRLPAEDRVAVRKAAEPFDNFDIGAPVAAPGAAAIGIARRQGRRRATARR